jgi:hypothetical protein
MKTWLLKFFGSLGEFLSVLFTTVIKKELNVALPIALEAVKQVANDSALTSGSAKRDAALALIAKQLVSVQLSIAMSTISLALELAYTKYKSENPDA